MLEPRTSYKLLSLAPYCLIVFFLIFSWTVLLHSPIPGIADNGDYWRVMTPAGIEHTAPRESYINDYVRRTFTYTQSQTAGIISSSSLTALLARYLCQSFCKQSAIFDLRVLAVVYLGILTVFTYLMLRFSKRVVLTTLCLWVLVDPNYLLFFNSFYTEPLLFVSVLAVITLLMQIADTTDQSRELSALRLFMSGVLLALISLLGGLTKPPYSLLPLTVLLSLIIMLAVRREFSRRFISALLLPVFVAALAAPFFFTRFQPKSALGDLYMVNGFNAVFFGIAKASENPDKALQQLKVAQEHWLLSGKHFYETERSLITPKLREKLAQVSRIHLLWLYLKDPQALRAVLTEISGSINKSRLKYPGHFEKSAGLQRAEFVVPWQFSKLRDGILGRIPILWWLITLGALLRIFFAGSKRKWSGIHTVELFLLLTMLTQIPISVLGDGLFALGRHLILARLALDLLVMLFLYEAGSRLVDLRGVSRPS